MTVSLPLVRISQTLSARMPKRCIRSLYSRERDPESSCRKRRHGSSLLASIGPAKAMLGVFTLGTPCRLRTHSGSHRYGTPRPWQERDGGRGKRDAQTHPLINLLGLGERQARDGHMARPSDGLSLEREATVGQLE